MDIAEKN